MADMPAVLRVVDLLNIWGLMLIGLALVLGLWTRLSALLGVLLIGLYYVANPPFVGLRGVTMEGNALIINKNLIEIVALLAILMARRGATYGLDNIIAMIRKPSASGRSGCRP
jgi:thiosulfate dehydrogenase [quinone] large subunit